MEIVGIEFADLPDGVTPLECVITIKALNEDGELALYERLSEGLTSWEALGMVMTLADSVRHALARD